jgi:hypothetical protein
VNLQEAQATGRFAWRPGGNLIYVPGAGVLLLLVNEGALVFDTLRPKEDLPHWALSGRRHERGCPCGGWEESPHGADAATPAIPTEPARDGRVQPLWRVVTTHLPQDH